MSPAQKLRGYLRMLAGERPGRRLIEVRYSAGGGAMHRRFIPAARAETAARWVLPLSARTDVYTGVLLRDQRAGGRDAVSGSHLVFVETDTADGQARLERFSHDPSMLIASGTPGHLHAYWRLCRPIDALELEGANRRLAHHLGGDLTSVDAARILRPPASLNHKHSPPAPVTLLEWRAAKRYRLDELLDGLEDPPGSPHRGPAGPRRRARTPLDELLLAIPAAQYVRALAGLEPNRHGKVRCPFHDDSNPSLQLYEDGTWFCFGCRRGGSAYDFAAHLWGRETKGHAFLELRATLAGELGIPADARPARAHPAG